MLSSWHVPQYSACHAYDLSKYRLHKIQAYKNALRGHIYESYHLICSNHVERVPIKIIIQLMIMKSYNRNKLSIFW